MTLEYSLQRIFSEGDIIQILGKFIGTWWNHVFPHRRENTLSEIKCPYEIARRGDNQLPLFYSSHKFDRNNSQVFGSSWCNINIKFISFSPVLTRDCAKLLISIFGAINNFNWNSSRPWLTAINLSPCLSRIIEILFLCFSHNMLKDCFNFG